MTATHSLPFVIALCGCAASSESPAVCNARVTPTVDAIAGCWEKKEDGDLDFPSGSMALDDAIDPVEQRMFGRASLTFFAGGKSAYYATFSVSIDQPSEPFREEGLRERGEYRLRFTCDGPLAECRDLSFERTCCFVSDDSTGAEGEDTCPSSAAELELPGVSSVLLCIAEKPDSWDEFDFTWIRL